MRKFLFGMMALLLVGMLAGCGGGEKKTQTQTLLVGTEPTFAPFEFQAKDSKEYTGFDMDLIRAIGKELNAKVEIKGMGFDALIPALNSKTIDLAIAGMSITEDRKKSVAFSKPYYMSGLVVLVNKNETKIKSIDDLKGKTIAAQIGNTGAATAEKVPGAKVKKFDTYDAVFLELKNKGADAVIVDKPVAEEYVGKKGGDSAKIVGKTLNAEPYGIAARKDNTKLIADVDKAIDKLQKSGEYDKIYKKWFGKAPSKN